MQIRLTGAGLINPDAAKMKRLRRFFLNLMIMQRSAMTQLQLGQRRIQIAALSPVFNNDRCLRPILQRQQQARINRHVAACRIKHQMDRFFNHRSPR